MANTQLAKAPEPTFLTILWRALKKIDHSKINSKWLALRNALAVAAPLAIGIELHQPLAAVSIATGALNVAYSDGRDPYSQRARRMLGWSVLGAVAVFLGSVTGNYPVLAILVATAWAFLAGLLVSISTRAGDLGLNTLVALIVFAARGALSPSGAFLAALLVFAGGVLQTVLALLFWPVQRYTHERRAVGDLYAALAREVDPASPSDFAAALEPPSSELQDALSAIGRDHSAEGERLRVLYDQTNRLRLSIHRVDRLRSELLSRRYGSPRVPVYLVDDLLQSSCQVLASISDCLLGKKISEEQQQREIAHLNNLLPEFQRAKNRNGDLASEFASAADILVGQLRVVHQIAHRTTLEGAADFYRQEHDSPIKLQLRNWLSILRANLTLRSAACKHALRMAVCIALADMISRGISVQRSYWLPMTVAVILKPDFTTTISRGVLRLAGTFFGLVLATVLFHLMPQSGLTQLFLVGIFTFFLRYLGPGNYGVFSTAVSGLIVFLVAVSGISPADVVVQRAINTAAGGVFALLAYSLWPTWERTHVSEEIAKMIDATREYFHAVITRFKRSDDILDATLDRTRAEWRRARSNAEASVDRVAGEPGTNASKLEILTSMLASSHSLVYAVLSLEAAAIQMDPQPLPPPFEAFAHDVDFTLYYSAAALRGSRAATGTLPQLWQDHRRMLEARNESTLLNEYVLTETDVLTVSLNTLREQVSRYIS